MCFIRELKYRQYRQLIRLWHLEIHGQTVSVLENRLPFLWVVVLVWGL